MSVSRRLAGVVLAGVMVSNVGCYTYQPLVGTAVQPGQRVSFELTDQGRASLSEQLGPGVLEVQGTLQDIRNEQYVLGVTRVTTIGGGAANWGGERVTIPVSSVSRSGIRAFSRERTALVVGAAVVAIGVFIASRNLVGGGLTAATDTTKAPPAGTSRAPW